MITDQQRKAVHVGFQIIADQLNELGHGMHVVLNTKRDKYLLAILTQIYELSSGNIAALANKAIIYLESKQDIQIKWTKETVKDALFKPIIKAMFQVESTTKLDTTQVSDAWDELIGILLKNDYLEQAIDFLHDKQE